MTLALPELSPERASIFRITHVANVAWILDHGLHCRSSNVLDQNYHEIGNPDLIGKRAQRPVPIPPGGTLSDYVPFYFTPRTPMLMNIATGYGGLARTPRQDIVIVAASLRRLAELRVPFVFTDRHAYLMAAQFSNDLQELAGLDWESLRASAFKKDPDDPERFERYQAEALIHGHVPLGALDGIVCYGDGPRAALAIELTRRGITIRLTIEPDWYC